MREFIIHGFISVKLTCDIIYYVQVECSNGYTGYGRKKREVQNKLYDPKKVFEISLTAFIKVDYS